MGKGIIKISQAYENDGFKKARDTADNMLDKLYGFHLGPVLFKPTLSGVIKHFGKLKKGFIIFVGHNSDFPMIPALALNIGEKLNLKPLGFLLMDQLQCGWVGSLS